MSSVWDDCVAYWPLNEASDVTRADAVGSWDLADSVAAVDAVTGKLGNGARSTGAGSLFATTSPPSALSGGAISVSGWVKIHTDDGLLADTPIFMVQLGSHYVDLQYDEVANRFQVEFNDGVDTVTLEASIFGAVSTATWYHLAVAWSGGNGHIWVNGIGPDTASSMAATLDDSDTFTSALYANNDISIDEWGVWDGALDTLQVRELYNSGAGLAYGSSPSSASFFAFHGF